MQKHHDRWLFLWLLAFDSRRIVTLMVIYWITALSCFIKPLKLINVVNLHSVLKGWESPGMVFIQTRQTAWHRSKETAETRLILKGYGLHITPNIWPSLHLIGKQIGNTMIIEYSGVGISAYFFNCFDWIKHNCPIGSQINSKNWPKLFGHFWKWNFSSSAQT